MLKLAILLGFSLAASVAAGEFISCKNIKQISFEQMEQDTNVCHFLQEKVAANPLVSHGTIETCFCNIINKDKIWDGILNRQTKKLHKRIVERLELLSNGYFNLKRRLSSDRGALMGALEWGPKREPPMKQYKPKKITEACERVVRKFSKYLHIFDNFDHFTGDQSIRLQLISRSPNVESLFVTYTVCKKLGY